ncbi:MAG: HlyD family efflux transporter periplasmic adaptor subunit [Candidatus Obscuribacterales bacterium]|nr:HlyD family efflux transporter periplasmic adaptor subunit [Candidatus Obscuribacterales bacterium]
MNGNSSDNWLSKIGRLAASKHGRVISCAAVVATIVEVACAVIVVAHTVPAVPKYRLIEELFLSAKSSDSRTITPRSKAPLTVTALGRLEPIAEVSRISVPSFLKDERVAELCVEEGQWLDKGSPICVLDARERLRAQLEESKCTRSVQEAKLERVKSGAKRGETDAQKSAIATLELERKDRLLAQDAVIEKAQREVAFHEKEARRYRELASAGAVSASQFDSKVVAADVSRAQLSEAGAQRQCLLETYSARIAEAKATLSKIAEVRSTDVAVAKAELDETDARVRRIERDMALATVKAPRAGRILRLTARRGEAVGEKGIAEFGATDKMQAVAEVYESDIKKITLGQRATINGDALGGPVHGSVSTIGCQVQRQNVFSQDPASDSDARIVAVKILIDKSDNKRVESLTNLQVEIAFR